MLEKLAKQTAVYGISTIVVRFLSYLLTPYYTRVFGQETYGVVTDIFPEVGELVGSGAPIMNVSVINDMWFTFNVREDMLPGMTVGTEMDVYVPAFDKNVRVRIDRIKEEGSFATWKATKALDKYDLKTFEVEAYPLDPAELAGLRVGMTAVFEK